MNQIRSLCKGQMRNLQGHLHPLNKFGNRQNRHFVSSRWVKKFREGPKIQNKQSKSDLMIFARGVFSFSSGGKRKHIIAAGRRARHNPGRMKKNQQEYVSGCVSGRISGCTVISSSAMHIKAGSLSLHLADIHPAAVILMQGLSS